MKCLAIILWALLASVAAAQDVVVIGRAPVASSTLLLSDDLDYADNAAAASAGWTNASTPVWGSVTSPAPVDGVSATALELNTSADSALRTFTASGEVWFYIILNVSSLASTNNLIYLLDSSSTELARLAFLSTGAVRGYNGGSNNTSSAGTVVAATTYHIWFRYVKGTGANSITQTWVATSATKPGSTTTSYLIGASTTDCDRIRIGSSSTNAVILLNKLRVYTTDPGSSPP
jgi:hypothetical protein